MIQSFRDQGTADLFAGADTKAARKCLPTALHRMARRRLGHLDAATSLVDLLRVRGNDLHALEKDRKGQHAVRINDVYRICFTWTDAGPTNVEVVDYH
jgi:proteic killer suppression protein